MDRYEVQARQDVCQDPKRSTRAKQTVLDGDEDSKNIVSSYCMDRNPFPDSPLHYKIGRT